MSSLSDDAQDVVYAMVSNIPLDYHSKDLRSFFSSMVECDKFHCFHFLHRPDVTVLPSCSAKPNGTRTRCAVVALRRSNRNELLHGYNGKRWYNWKTVEHPHLGCLVYAIQGPDEDSCCRELMPPKLMPKGNVGTPTKHFLQLIRDCRLPAKVIGNLGLKFPKSVCRRIYNEVNYCYGSVAEPCHSASDAQQSDIDADPAATSEREELDQELDNDECEEWERHEAFNEDCGKQERLNERLYEKELEIVWEKGGPGLVFYTDAFQRDQEETDTDSRWADEWDIDMSVYYAKSDDYDVGDKDAKDMMEMRRSQRRAQGLDDDSVFRSSDLKLTQKRQLDESHLTNTVDSYAFGSFEQHTKGIGRRLLEKHGWKLGQPLSRHGRPDPIALEMNAVSQTPRQKQGFGYRGEKLQRYGFAKETDHFIRTIYDQNNPDSCDTALRRSELTYVKYNK